MDTSLDDKFIKDITNVLFTMAAITATPWKPYVRRCAMTTGVVTRLVGLTGVKAGGVSISFDKVLAIASVKNTLGDDIQDILQEVKEFWWGIGSVPLTTDLARGFR